MRTINFDLTADDASTQYGFAGFEGEHNATLLSVRLPERMKGKIGAEYRFLFETAKGEAVFSMPVMLSEDGSVSVVLTRPLMFPPSLKAYVGCFVREESETVLIAKTSEMILGVQCSLDQADNEMSLAGGGVPGLVIDAQLSSVSENPVQNKVIFQELEKKLERNDVPVDSELNASSTNPVQNKVVFQELKKKLERSDVPVDTALKASSTNPVQNNVLYAALNEKLNRTEYKVETQFDAYSRHPLQNKVISQNVANAVSVTVSGNPIYISDLSPIDHLIHVVAQCDPPRKETIVCYNEGGPGITSFRTPTDENGILDLWSNSIAKYKTVKISASSDVTLVLTYNRNLNLALDKKLEKKDVPVDENLSPESENPVQNQVVSNAFANALKKKMQGNPIVLNHPSPISHSIAVKVEKDPSGLRPSQSVANVTKELSEYSFQNGLGAYTVTAVEGVASEDQIKITFADSSFAVVPNKGFSFEPGEVLLLVLSEEEGDEVLCKTVKENLNLKKHGKNLFDASKMLQEASWKEENGCYTGTSHNLWYRYNENTDGYMSLDGIETATISFYGCYNRTQEDAANGLIVYFVYEDGTNDFVKINSKTERFYTLTSARNKKLKKLCFSYGSESGTHFLRNVQLELGAVASEYEVYHEPTSHVADEKGVVNLVCNGQEMMLSTDFGGALVTEYNLDVNWVVEEMQRTLSNLSAQILNV